MDHFLEEIATLRHWCMNSEYKYPLLSYFCRAPLTEKPPFMS